MSAATSGPSPPRTAALLASWLLASGDDGMPKVLAQAGARYLAGHEKGSGNAPAPEVPWVPPAEAAPDRPTVAFGPERDGSDLLWAAVALVGPVRNAAGAPGRPQHRRFSVPYGELAASGTTYSSLYAVVDGMTLPPTGGGPVELVVPRADPAETAAAVDEIGFEWVAAVAALLLHGPVAIIGAAALPLAKRLACLDAVTALLPYGCRAGLSVSTWTVAGSYLPNLAFAETAGPEQRAVRLGQRPDLPATAGDYQSLLRRARDQVDATVGVTEHLAGRRKPCGIDGPEPATAILAELAPAYLLLQRVRVGTALPVEVSRRLQSDDLAALRSGERQEVLRYLFLRDRRQVREMLGTRWAPEVVDIMAADTRDKLVTGAVPEGAQYFALLAEQDGRLESYLAAVLELPLTTVRDEARARAEAAGLLRSPPPPKPTEWASVRDRLNRQPALAHELLRQEIEGGDGVRLQAFLEWLQGRADAKPPPWLRPYQVAILPGQHGELRAEELADLAEQGPPYLVALLRAAQLRDHAEQVLTALFPWFVKCHARFEPSDAIELTAALDRFPPSDAVSQTWADLLRLLFARSPQESPPTSLLDALDSGDFGAEDLVAVFQTVSHDVVGSTRAALVDTVADLFAKDWVEAPGRRVPLLLITAQIGTIATSERVLGALMDGLDGAERPLDDPSIDDALLQHLEERYPVLRRHCALARVGRALATQALARHVDQRVDMRRVAELWADARACGCRANELLAVVRHHWRDLDVGEAARAVDNLLYEVRLQLKRRWPRDGASAHDEIMGDVVRGELGPVLSDAYFDWARQFAAEEVEHWTATKRFLDQRDRQPGRPWWPPRRRSVTTHPRSQRRAR